MEKSSVDKVIRSDKYYQVELVSTLGSILDFLDGETKGTGCTDKIRSEVLSIPKLWEQLERDSLGWIMDTHVDNKELHRQLEFLFSEEMDNAMDILNKPWTDLLAEPVLGPVMKSLAKSSKLFRQVFKLSHSSLTQAKIGQIMGLSQPAVRQRVSEAKCLLPFMVGLKKLHDDLSFGYGSSPVVNYQFVPYKNRSKMPFQSVFSISIDGDLVANLFCIAPIDETDLTSLEDNKLDTICVLGQRMKEVKKEYPFIPVLIYQYSCSSLEWIFSEPESFIDLYPRSLSPRGLFHMKRMGVESWGSYWHWHDEH